MNRKGFTLIELLVVIAIIAILAAILFPVFAQVRLRVHQTTCMTQMHEIGMNIKLYYEDNNRYPAALFGYAEIAGGAFYQGGAGSPQKLDLLHYKPLFNKQRYLKDNALFVCPVTKDKTKGPTTTAVYPQCTPLAGSAYIFTPLIQHNMGKDGDGYFNSNYYPNKPIYFYKYDNYDVQPRPNATLDGPDPTGAYEVHYALDWSLGSTPATTPADYAVYPNQLKYGSLADDSHTVVTWCSEHAINANSDKVLVLTLGLNTKVVDKKAFYSKGPLNILR